MDTEGLIRFLLEGIPLFKDFPRQRLEELLAGSRVGAYAANEAIIEFAQEGRFLGVLLEGEAEVSFTDDSGVRHPIATMRPGELFGEMSLMTGDKTVADIIATAPCRALLIPRELFSSVLITYPPAIRLLSKTISDRMRDTAAKELSASALRRSGDPYGFSLAADQPTVLLVINCGSSSLKYTLYRTGEEAGGCKGIVERIGGKEGMKLTQHSPAGKTELDLPPGSHKEAFSAMVAELTHPKHGVIGCPAEVHAVGHRVVHGGERFQGPVLIDPDVLAQITALSVLAPLHNPVNSLGIREAQAAFPRALQVAVFDTAFHHTLAPHAFLYGLPYEYYTEKHIRKYGFHGMSHKYVSLKTAEFLKRPYNELTLISCHLGNGASVCAIDHGRSVDTSMGLTPAEGLLMGTRTGSMDPAIIPYLMRTEGMDVGAIERMINHEGGLRGLSGLTNDMREIERAADAGDYRALIACKVFSYRVRSYIGSYVAAVGGGLDALVFTGGIGQGSAGVRSLACQGLTQMGIILDERANLEARGFEGICDITGPGSAVRVLVVPTDEERMIARETLHVISTAQLDHTMDSMEAVPIPVEVSAHHVHLSQLDVEALFGLGHGLTFEAALSQPGQFASSERVTLVGPKGRVERVRILGPVRKETQVEISMTEQFRLGLHPPIRESGDLAGTPGLTLEGPAGSVTIERGVICALRHIHMPPEDALRFGLRDKSVVRVRVEGKRELVYGDVLVRVHPNYRLALHLDTDEGNAADITTGMAGYIERVQHHPR